MGARAPIAIAVLALSSVGCSRVEKWVSANADESIAHKIELITDKLTDGNRYPSGLPIRRKKVRPSSSAEAPPLPSAEASATAP